MAGAMILLRSEPVSLSSQGGALTHREVGVGDPPEPRRTSPLLRSAAVLYV
jgi:hypothetical protein